MILFQEDNIHVFGMNASLTYGPELRGFSHDNTMSTV